MSTRSKVYVLITIVLIAMSSFITYKIVHHESSDTSASDSADQVVDSINNLNDAVDNLDSVVNTVSNISEKAKVLVKQNTTEDRLQYLEDEGLIYERKKSK